MKKFLGKKVVMIALIVAFVVTTIITSALMAVPIFYAGSYSGSYTVGKTKTKEYFNFNSNNVMTYTSIVTKDGKEEKSEVDYWYYRYEDEVLIVGTYKSMTEEEYEDQVKEILDSNKFKDEIDEYGCEIDFVSFETGERDYTNKTAIAIIACLGVVDFVIAAAAVLAVLIYINNKKNKPVEEKVEAPETQE